LAKDKKQKALTKSIEENKYVVFGMLGLFLILVFLASSYKVSGDDDFFWHLATGRFVVENKYVPDKDVFGYLTENDEWIPFEWGWDVMTFGLYKMAGYNAILVFRSIVFCLIFLIYFLLLKKFKVNSLVNIIVLFTLLVAVIDRLSPRPHIISYLFLITILYIILSFKYIERDKYLKKLYFLPLIFLLWGNIHLGVLAGGLFLFIFTVTELLIFYYPRHFKLSEVKPLTEPELKRLLIISFLCALVLLVNPHGFQTYVYAYGHTKMKMLETINEWQAPFSTGMDFGFVVALYKVFIYLGIIVLVYAFKKRDLLFALTYIGFAIYSIRAIRLTVDYEIVIAFFIAVSLNYYALNLFSRTKIFTSNVPKVVVAAFFIYVITQIPSNKIYESLRYYRIFGWGINDDFLAIQLYDFMKENNIKGRPYNHFGTGGGLVWNFPDQKNFLDSRNLNDRIFNEYNYIMTMKPGFEKKLDEYGVDYVIYLDPDLIRRPNELKRLVTAYFCRSKDWKLVFWDDKSMLFLKETPKFAELINKYEYKVFNPYTALFFQQEFEANIRNSPETARNEIKRKADTEPNGYLQKGMYDIAAKVLK
jgi:hypothetical protein